MTKPVDQQTVNEVHPSASPSPAFKALGWGEEKPFLSAIQQRFGVRTPIKGAGGIGLGLGLASAIALITTQPAAAAIFTIDRTGPNSCPDSSSFNNSIITTNDPLEGTLTDGTYSGTFTLSSSFTDSSTQSTERTEGMVGCEDGANGTDGNDGQEGLHIAYTGDNVENASAIVGWGLEVVFDVSLIEPAPIPQLIIRGRSATSENSYGSRFSSYAFSWDDTNTGGALAIIIDPDDQIVGYATGDPLPNGGSFVQQDCNATQATDDCQQASSPAIKNELLTWEVVFPLGASGATISAIGGASKEGFGYDMRFVDADLHTTKTVDNSTPSEGDTVVYTITVENRDAIDVTNVSVQDVLPAGLTFVSAVSAIEGNTAEGGTYTAGSGIWDIGTLAAGETATLEISATVDAGQAGQTINNTIAYVDADQLDVSTSDDLSESISVVADFGDAPDTYGTDVTDTGGEGVGPSHTIVSGLALGTAPDAEVDAETPLDGSGDGSEDDGVTLPTLAEGDTTYTIPAANITATNTTGGPATLHAWVDFDKSGTFEAGEYASVTVNDATNGGNPAGDLTWNSVTAGTAGDTYARFRLTTDGSINANTPGGAASDGEVEDYQVAIANAAPTPTNLITGNVFEDFGGSGDGNDSPDTGETRLGDITLTLYQDTDSDGVFNASSDTVISTTDSNADGTYTLPVYADGDYFVVLDHLDSDAPSTTIALPDRTVRAVTVAGADVSDQDFPYDTLPPNFGACPVDGILTKNNPSDVFGLDLVTGNVQLLEEDLNEADGSTVYLNAMGYSVVDNYIYGYGQTAPYGTVIRIDGNNQATVLPRIPGFPDDVPDDTGGNDNILNAGDVSRDGKLYIRRGTTDRYFIIDVNPNSSTYLQYLGSIVHPNKTETHFADIAFHPQDGYWYTVGNPSYNLKRINPATGIVEDLGNTGLTAGSFGAMFFDAAGYFYIADNDSPGNLYRIDVTDPSNPIPTAVQLGQGPTSALNDGARCMDAPVNIDFGDAPDTGTGTGTGNYNTLLSDGGPAHGMINGLHLGSGVTADADGFDDGTDDNNDATDDTDDGVQLGGSSLQGQSLNPGGDITLDIATQGNGVLNAWIDWDGDGEFEASEQVATDESPTADAISLSVTVPSDATVGTTYARFRYSSDTGLDPTGTASDGEVEDYQVAIAAASNPNVSLVKRITAINNIPIPFDGPQTQAEIDAEGLFPANFLQGTVDGGATQPGDEIEYTIYFVSDGDTTAENLAFCDLVPEYTTFNATAFNIDPATQDPGGILGASRGIVLGLGSDELSITNLADSDRGVYVQPGDATGLDCGGTNDNGAVVVFIGDVPNASSNPTPNTSYGFVRFRARVN